MVMVVLGLYDPSPFDLSKIPFPWHVWLGQDTSLPPAMSSWGWFEWAQLFHLAWLPCSHQRLPLCQRPSPPQPPAGG